MVRNGQFARKRTRTATRRTGALTSRQANSYTDLWGGRFDRPLLSRESLMKFSAILLFALGLSPALFAQKKEVLEMQRDILQMQDQVRSLNEKIAQMQVLLQQTLDLTNKTNTSVAVLQTTLADRVGEQTKNLVGPVAGVGSKV